MVGDRGVFITFEGGEGCGKSTQVKLLKSALEERGIEVVLTREPGGTWLSEEIRRLIKDQEVEEPCARAEMLLFLSARAQLVQKVIRPALDAGKWVISDRFSDSTLAYQGYGRGLPLAAIRQANDFACDELKPDVTLLLEVSPEISQCRMHQREAATKIDADRIERAGDDFHLRLARGFRELAAAEPERIRIIDANGTVEDTWQAVWKSLKHLV